MMDTDPGQKGADMTTTLEDLEQRLGRVEEELASLRQWVEPRPPAETAAERGARLLREAKASQPAVSAAVDQAFAEMGITGEPVTQEQLRQMFAEAGIRPEENLFSREITAMREE
jgi:hypothetical protein